MPTKTTASRRARSAITGRFVKQSSAVRYPKTTASAKTKSTKSSKSSKTK